MRPPLVLGGEQGRRPSKVAGGSLTHPGAEPLAGQPARLYCFTHTDVPSREIGTLVLNWSGELMAKLTPEASRAARAILEWSMRDLAREAGVSLSTIQNIEKPTGDYRQSTAEKVIGAFAKNGVEILNGDAPGARRRSV